MAERPFRSNLTSLSILISVGVTYLTDPRVDVYIDALHQWQQAICSQVRDLVHTADPEVTETIKRTTQPYFVLAGIECALLGAKDHVNVFSTTGPSRRIRTRSSPEGTRTRQPERLRCAKATPGCSGVVDVAAADHRQPNWAGGRGTLKSRS